MKKVLHWNERFGNSIGGGEIYLANIMKNMPEFKHFVINNKLIPKPNNEYSKKFEKIIFNSTSPVITTPKKVAFPINILSTIIRLHQKKNIMKQINPDLNVIHGLGLFGSLERLNFLLGIDLIKDNYFHDINPKILIIHNLLSPIFPKNNEKFLNYENKIFNQFDTIICVDNYIYSYLKKIYPSKKIYFISNSLPNYFLNNRYKKKKYNLKSPVVGFVGRYEYSRGIHILRKMVMESPKSFKFILIFSTNRSSRKKIINNFNSNRGIDIYFNIPNRKLPTYYNKMDFLFNPVIVKGISRVSLEAMAMGTLPIMLDPGDRYPVKDSETGILFKEKKLFELIDRLKNLTSKEFYAMKKSAEKISKEQFSNSKLIPRLRDILKTI